MKEKIYKIVWVDDDTSIVDYYQDRAEVHSLELVHFTNWEEAYEELSQKFDYYSAVILDAFCKKSPGDIVSENFLVQAVGQLKDLMGKNQKDIPWYILSSITPERENWIESVRGLREDREDNWGLMEYSKIALEDDIHYVEKLFDNIQRVAAQKSLNIVLYRYEGMFKYLGEGKLYGAEARKLMLMMLSALYYPEETPNYQYNGNGIRKVVEHMFRAANKYGLLADECFYNGDKINLTFARLYMAGRDVFPKDGSSPFRYGEAGPNYDGGGGDSIFPQDIASIVNNIIPITSKGGTLGSHTTDETGDLPYVNDKKYKDLFFGYVLQLCHILTWFGKYVEQHPDKEENKKMKRLIPIGDNSIDNSTEKNVFQENRKNYQDIEATPQDGADMPQEIDTTPQEQEVPMLTEVSRDDVVGKEFVALNGIILSHTMDCKLSPDCIVKVKAGDKVRIVDVVENTEDDRNKFPFIATKVELLND